MFAAWLLADFQRVVGIELMHSLFNISVEALDRCKVGCDLCRHVLRCDRGSIEPIPTTQNLTDNPGTHAHTHGTYTHALLITYRKPSRFVRLRGVETQQRVVMSGLGQILRQWR